MESRNKDKTNSENDKSIVTGIIICLLFITLIISFGFYSKSTLSESGKTVKVYQEELLSKISNRNNLINDVIRFSYSYLGQETEKIQELNNDYNEYKNSNNKLEVNKKIDEDLNYLINSSKSYPLIENDYNAKHIFEELEKDNKTLESSKNNYNTEAEFHNKRLDSFPYFIYNKLFKYEKFPLY